MGPKNDKHGKVLITNINEGQCRGSPCSQCGGNSRLTVIWPYIRDVLLIPGWPWPKYGPPTLNMLIRNKLKNKINVYDSFINILP